MLAALQPYQALELYTGIALAAIMMVVVFGLITFTAWMFRQESRERRG